MHASGLFFLRAGLYSAKAANGQPVLLLPLCEREGLDNHSLVAYWSGADSQAFVQTHGALKAGTALQIELRHLRCINNEIHAHVATCVLAPARWPASTSPSLTPS